MIEIFLLIKGFCLLVSGYFLSKNNFDMVMLFLFIYIILPNRNEINKYFKR